MSFLIQSPDLVFDPSAAVGAADSVDAAIPTFLGATGKLLQSPDTFFISAADKALYIDPAQRGLFLATSDSVLDDEATYRSITINGAFFAQDNGGTQSVRLGAASSVSTRVGVTWFNNFFNKIAELTPAGALLGSDVDVLFPVFPPDWDSQANDLHYFANQTTANIAPQGVPAISFHSNGSLYLYANGIGGNFPTIVTNSPDNKYGAQYRYHGVRMDVITANNIGIYGSPANGFELYFQGSDYLTGTGNGGDVRLLGGESSGGNGGNIVLEPGAGGVLDGYISIKNPSGTVDLRANYNGFFFEDDSVNDANPAQDFNILSQSKVAGTGNGGNFNFTSGSSLGGKGGDFILSAGSGENGGELLFAAGGASGATGVAGNAIIQGGAGDTGGTVFLIGGATEGPNPNVGGLVSIFGGTSESGAGGDVTVEPGAGVTPGLFKVIGNSQLEAQSSDEVVLRAVSSTTTGILRQHFDNSDSTQNFNIVAQFGAGTEKFAINRLQGGSGRTLAFVDMDGDWTIGSISGNTHTIIGSVTFQDNIQMSSSQIVYAQNSYAGAGTGTAQTVDFNLGNVTVLDLQDYSGDVTLTLSNAVVGGSYGVKIIQGSVARNVIWPAAVLWPGGTPPTISATDNAIDLVKLYYDGTNYLATFEQDFA